MITHHKVDGYENFLKLMRILDCKGKIVLYFHGSSDPAGLSWSAACNSSGPVILEMLKQNDTKNLHFVAVGIGTSQDHFILTRKYSETFSGMITYHKVEGYDACIALLKQLEAEKNIVLYFAGSVDEAGHNWCPDCEVAEPIVLEIVKANESKTFHFVHVAVGTREVWKNPECPFRKDEKFKLTSVPTLMKFKGIERLNDVECQNKDNVAMIFENIA